jgi:hypothetical protein
VVPTPGKPGVAMAFIVLTAVAAWPTIVVITRRKPG